MSYSPFRASAARYLGRADLARIAVVLLFVLLYVAPIGVRPLASPDEVRYGTIAHEMLKSGDWISPSFNGVRYFEKPVLGYWITAISMAVFGENEFALRLPFSLATGLTALIVFSLTRRFVSPSAAILASTIFLTTLIVAGVGTFAVLDPLLVLCTTAALAAWFLALQEPSRNKRLRYLVCCGIACGGAFLTKGLVGWAIPATVAAGHLAAQRQWRSVVTLPWIPIVVAALVAAPWAILIHLREPDFWHYFFWMEHINRFAGEDAQHARPWWLYLASLPVIAWPWILAWPTALRGISASIRRDPFLQFVAIWAIGLFVFFSIPKGKLLTYVLPCFPAISILLAAGLERQLERDRRQPLAIATLVLAAAFALGLAGFFAAQTGAFGVPPFGESESIKLAMFLILLVVGFFGAVAAYRGRRAWIRLAAMALAGATLTLSLQVVLPQSALQDRAIVVDIEQYDPGPGALLISDGSTFGTVAWAYKRDDIYLISPGEIEYGLSYPEASFRRLSGRMLSGLIAENRTQRDILIICRLATEQAIAAQLPATTTRIQHGSTVLLKLTRAQ